MLAKRLTRVDEISRGDHQFLNEDDACFFFGEYFAGKGYEGGDTNSLITNFKIKPAALVAKPQRRKYKDGAIREVAAALRTAVPKPEAEKVTWVPIPSSKVPGDENYDDRLSRALSEAFAGYDVDVRQLVRQTVSTESDHTAGARQSPLELLKILEIDRATLELRPVRRVILLFDDVLTTGKHFKCCQQRLREALGDETRIIGIFVARRVIPDATSMFEDLTDL